MSVTLEIKTLAYESKLNAVENKSIRVGTILKKMTCLKNL